MTEKLGIEVKIVWLDVHAVELCFNGCNERFGGKVEVYTGHEELLKMATSLQGFPKSKTDSREFEFGTFDPDYAGGGVRLRFNCNALGHVNVFIQMQNDPQRGDGSTTFSMVTEAAYINLFIDEIKRMNLTEGEAAHLRMRSA